MNKKIFLPIALLALAMLSIPFVSHALVAKSGDSLAINEVVEGNFFGSGNLITIAGRVNGDVFVAGNNVTISGIINGDVFVAGSSIEISGIVNGSVRALGSNINVRGTVERNVLAAGSSLVLSDGASVGRNLTFAGASLVINAPIAGQIDAAGGNVVLNSKVAGEVNLKLGEKGSLVLLPQANLGKNLSYTSPKEAQINSGAKVLGETKYRPWEKVDRKIPRDKALKFLKSGFIAGNVIGLIGLFIIGLILINLIPAPLKKIYEKMKENFWANVGIGLAVLVLTPIVCFVLLFTLVGAPLSIIVLLLYGIALYLVKAMASLAVGKWLAEKLKWKVHDAVSLIIGLVLVTLVGLIPVVGWALCLVLFLWTFGSFYQVKKQYLKELK